MHFPASDVRPSQLPMLWRDRIPASTLSVIAGDPGLGKSTLATMIAADLSRQGLRVIVSDVEDDLHATVRPRLEVAGADLDLVELVPVGYMPTLPRDLPQLEGLIRDIGAAAMFLDPIGAHYRPETRLHSRPDLLELIAVCRRTHCAVIGMHHLTKTGTIGGPNSGLFGSARAVYMYGYDPADRDRRALACEKINGVERPPTLIFDHDTVDYDYDGMAIEAGLLTIIDESNAEGKQTRTPGRGKRDRDAEVAQWLTDLLASTLPEGVRVRDVRDQARVAGYAWLSVQRARVAIKTQRRRAGGFGGAGWWEWSLHPEHPLRSPEVAEA